MKTIRKKKLFFSQGLAGMDTQFRTLSVRGDRGESKKEQSWKLGISNFTLLQVLGKGSFGKVCAQVHVAQRLQAICYTKYLHDSSVIVCSCYK